MIFIARHLCSHLFSLARKEKKIDIGPKIKLILNIWILFMHFFKRALFTSLLCTQILSASESNWKLDGHYTATTKAKLDEPGREGEKIAFASSRLRASYSHPLSEKSNVLVSLAHSGAEINWKENPNFRENKFATLDLALVGQSMKVPHWFLQGALLTKVDTDAWNFSRYALYQGFMWGRYSYSKLFGVHVGLSGTSGLRKDKVFPILGIDYSPNAKWKFQVIFPMDLSAKYKMSERWSLAAGAKSFRARHRLHKRENISQGIFEYRSYGSELSLNYEIQNFMAKIHSGMNFGGDLKISNSKGKDSIFYKYKSSVFFGSQLSYTF